MFKMASKSKRKDVLVVSADGIMNEHFVCDGLNFLDSHFIGDIWHILNGALTKIYGLHNFSYMKDDVAAMIQAGYEDEFNLISNVVRGHVFSDANLLSNF